jgi:hypothetical protein
LVELNSQGKFEASGGKTALVPHCPPKIAYGPLQDQILVFTIRDPRMTLFSGRLSPALRWFVLPVFLE